ncbi:MAG: ATP-binding protein [Vulcanimicrobiota bacterium]
MGLRLKGQLLALFVVLFSTALLILSYFNLSVLSLSNTLSAEEGARSTASKVLQQVTSLVPLDSSQPAMDLATRHEEVAAVLETEEVKALEVLGPDGGPLMKFGVSGDDPEARRETLQEVARNRLPTDYLVAYEASGDSEGHRIERLVSGGNRPVSFELYAPLTVIGAGYAGPAGFVHVSIEIPRAPLRLKLVAMINLVLAGTFLITSVLATNLWGEHAINRPLEGLVEAMHNHFHAQPMGEELHSNNELVNLSKTFNRMGLDLVKYQRELEAKTHRLEQANERYKALNEQLEHKVEEKTRDMKEFFSLVTHDLRIPLAAIQGYTDLLKRKQDQLDEKQVKFVKSIGVANSHALELVRNLLEAMKYEFGDPQIVTQRFELDELVDEVVSQLSAEETGPRIEVDLEDDLVVDADRTRISRVLTNLIGNAMRHSSSSERVEVRARRRGEKVELAVADDGPGISAEHLPLLFEKFKQFPSEAGPSSGLGLGLYIVGKIVEGHGSRVEVESELGKGTCFRFLLDIYQEPG